MKKVAFWAAVIPLFIIPFLPLYVEGQLFFPFIAGKGFAFRILIEIATGAWLLLAALDKGYRPKFSWTFAIYGVLVLWMLIADFFAVNPHKAFWSNYERMDGWITLAHTFLFFVVASSVLTAKKLWKPWWLTVLGASAIVAVHGILQVMGLTPIHQGGVRLDANFGNAAYLAAYLLFIVAISIWQGIEAKKSWLRYGLFALAGVQTILLFMTATRGAILAFVVAIILGALLWMFQSGKAGRNVGAGILVGVLVLIGGFFLIRHTSFVQDSPIFSRIESISAADGQVRFTLWHMAWEGVLTRPVTGFGHEGFMYVFSRYYDPSLYAQEPWFDRAHNVFIDWLVYGGFPAFFLFIGLLGASAIALYRAPVGKVERVLLISALAAYAFQALFVFDNLLSYILSAAIFATAHMGTSREWKFFEKPRELPESQAMVMGVVLGAATLVVVWFVNVPGIVGGIDLIKAASAAQTPDTALTYYKQAATSGTFASQEVAEQAISYATQVVGAASVATATKQDILTSSLQLMENEMKRVPQDARLALLYGGALAAAGDDADAAKAFEVAHGLSPQKQAIIVQQGLEAWKLNDTASAAKFFTDAYALAPESPDYATYGAAGQILLGDLTGANATLLATFGTTTVDSQVIRFAYAEKKLYPQLIASARLQVAANNGSADAMFNLARAYATAGDIAAARAEIQAAITAHPEAAAQGQQYLKALGG
jgi:O-antigen ligase